MRNPNPNNCEEYYRSSEFKSRQNWDGQPFLCDLQRIQPVIFDDVFQRRMLHTVAAGKIDTADVPCEDGNVCLRPAVRLMEACKTLNVLSEHIRAHGVAFVFIASLPVEFYHELITVLKFFPKPRMIVHDIPCAETAVFLAIGNEDAVAKMT